jgi:hypothetical protein
MMNVVFVGSIVIRFATNNQNLVSGESLEMQSIIGNIPGKLSVETNHAISRHGGDNAKAIHRRASGSIHILVLLGIGMCR